MIIHPYKTGPTVQNMNIWKINSVLIPANFDGRMRRTPPI